MTKKKTQPRRKRTNTETAVPTVPPQLAGLLALYTDNYSADADEMARAVAAARRVMRDPLAEAEVYDTVWTYITDEARRGSWKELHAAIDELTRPEDSSFNAINGDFQNVYGGPAFMMGIALAYVFLREGGQ
jgi:hypothetical protein